MAHVRNKCVRYILKDWNTLGTGQAEEMFVQLHLAYFWVSFQSLLTQF